MAIPCGPDDIVQLVRGTPDANTLIADLNSDPLFYSNWAAPPVENTGPILRPALHPGRRLDFDLNVRRMGSMDEVIAALQIVKQELTRGGVWLKFQRSTATSPVYFKIRPSDVTSISEFWTVAASTVHLSLRADPFSWGESVTWEAVIANYPVSGTNPMQYTFGPIEGDVVTPIFMEFDTPDDAHRIMWGSEANWSDDPVSPRTAPYQKPLWAPAKATIASWTISDTPDSAYVSGVRRTLTRSGGVFLGVPTAATLLTWDLPKGDYRVMVRAAGIDAGAELLFFNKPPRSGSTLVRGEEAAKYVATVGFTGLAWYDIGVVSLPGGAPRTDQMFGLTDTPDTALWQLAVYLPSTFSISLDTIMLIPVGRPETMTGLGTVEFGAEYSSKHVLIDGINQQRIAIGAADLAPSADVPIPPSDLSGGYPVLMPGADNILTFMRTVDTASSTQQADDKNATTSISGKYFPQYINDRPEAS